MEDGKCSDCGKPTTKRKDGEYWRTCFDCKTKKATEQSQLPVRSMQEQMEDILSSFEYAFKRMGELAPGMTPELKAQCAMHLNNQYWKNDRTPR
jgi:uncharacterized Zn finger protein (UPF0148 family)